LPLNLSNVVPDYLFWTRSFLAKSPNGFLISIAEKHLESLPFRYTVLPFDLFLYLH